MPSKLNVTSDSEPSPDNSKKPESHISATPDVSWTPVTSTQKRKPKPVTKQPEPEPVRLPGGQRKDGWEHDFLTHYAEWGNKSKAALVADVSLQTVRRREAESSAFAELVREARQAFVENLEMRLVEMGHKNNALAIIARLRAELPEKYHEKLQIDAAVKSISLNVTATPEQASVLLREMLAEVTDATRATLQALPGRSELSLPSKAGEITDAELVERNQDATTSADAAPTA
jgi:hypothetical protein